MILYLIIILLIVFTIYFIVKCYTTENLTDNKKKIYNLNNKKFVDPFDFKKEIGNYAFVTNCNNKYVPGVLKLKKIT